MRLSSRLHMLRIVLSVGVQTALPPMKESTKWFHLLLISVYQDADVMFMFRISPFVIRWMTADGKVLWLGTMG